MFVGVGSQFTVTAAGENITVNFDVGEMDTLPSGFKITIDGQTMSSPMEIYTLTTTLDYGEYSYSITADNYEEATGSFVLDASTASTGSCDVSVTGFEVKKAQVQFVPSGVDSSAVSVTVDETEHIGDSLLGEYSFGSTHTYKAEAEGYITLSGTFTVDSEVLNIPLDFKEDKPDFTLLDQEIDKASIINAEDYTASTAEVFKAAYEAALSIERENLKYEDQNRVDELAENLKNAIDGLLSAVTLDMSAVAVSSSIETNNGAADTIYILFSSPTNGADIMANLSVSDGTLGNSYGEWSNDNTIYTVHLSDSQLENGAEIIYTSDESTNALKDINGSIIRSTSASIKGNFEGLGEITKPDQMTSIIVKGSSRPTASAGDKIIIAFNAPVDENIIPSDLGISSQDVSGSFDDTKTIYTITLTSNNTGLSDEMNISYGDLSSKIAGSFGRPVIPELKKAVISDVNKTADTNGDIISFMFNAPTNGAVIDVSDFAGDGASAVWKENNTVLEITLGENASVINGSSVDLSGRGIKDEYSISDASITEITLEGSFGTVVVPELINGIIIDKDGTANTVGDEIWFVFSAPTNSTGIDLSDIVISTADVDFGNSVYEWINDGSVLKITLGSTAKVKNEMRLDLSGLGIMDSTSFADAQIQEVTVKGSFGTTLVPRITKAIAFTQGNSDIIRVYFNTPVKEAGGNEFEFGILPVSGGTFNTGKDAKAELSNSGTYFTVILGDDHDAFASGQYKIKFYSDSTNIVDSETGMYSLSETESIITGSFAEAIKPEIIDVTAVSNDGSGISKQGDIIYAVFNVAVNIGAIDISDGNFGDGYSIGYRDESSKNIVMITLGEGCNIVPGTTSLTFKNFTDLTTGTEVMADTEMNVSGSFGNYIQPELISLTAISNDGSGVAKSGDVIYAVFNVDVNIGTLEVFDGSLGTGGKIEYINDDLNNIVRITLGDGCDLVPGVTSIKFIGFENKLSGTVVPEITKIVGGSLGNNTEPQIINVTAVSNDGSGIPKQGDILYVVMNKPVTFDKDSAVATVQNIEIGSVSVDKDDKYLLEVELYDNVDLKVGDTLRITGLIDSVTGEKINYLTAVIGGSFGAAIDAVINNSVIYNTSEGTFAEISFSKAVVVGNPDIAATTTLKSIVGNNALVSLSDDGTTIVIKLSDDAGIRSDSRLNLSELDVIDAVTGKSVQNISNVALSGTVIPFVLNAVSECGEDGQAHIKIKFSARTTGEIQLKDYVTLLGVGAKAQWSENNSVLDITLGKDYSMTPNGYLVLNGMGIKGYYGGDAVNGQCKLNGSFTSGQLEVLSIMASSDNVSETVAGAGDKLTIRFSAYTDCEIGNVNIEDIISIGQLADREETEELTLMQLLGTGASAEWTDFDCLEITLGADPEIIVGDSIKVRGIKFANGSGEIDSDKLHIIEGSFDGRDIKVDNVSVTRTNGDSGDWRVSANIMRVKSGIADVTPTVVCVAYNKSNRVVALHRLSYDVAYSENASAIFEMPYSVGVKSVRIFVFDGELTDLNDPTKVLAVPVEAVYEEEK